nr:response regulator [Chitinophagaceae bacterium]
NKIEAGKLELENLPFELSKLVTEIVNANTLAAREKQNQISLQIADNIPSHLLGDAIRLGQVMNNLISNAIKFTDKGKIEITVSRMESEPENCRVMFAVTDSGIGIPMEKLSTIFLPFTQAGSSITRKYGGTGLGLSISQRILELMDSGLEVISETGKGSQFYFSVEFQMVGQAGEVIEEATDQEPDLKNKKILLVEDTAFNVLFATQLLEGWNAEVAVAENGAIAVEMVTKHQYDLILMDLQMPVMDGYTAARKIRDYNKALPIIALTASATSNVKSKVLEAGMQDYVTKPFNPNDFFLRLKKYL